MCKIVYAHKHTCTSASSRTRIYPHRIASKEGQAHMIEELKSKYADLQAELKASLQTTQMMQKMMVGDFCV